MHPDLPEPVVPAIKQVRHPGEVGPDGVAADVLAEPHAERACRRREVVEDVAERDEPRREVRHLDADRLLAGDRRQDADLGRRERVGEIVLAAPRPWTPWCPARAAARSARPAARRSGRRSWPRRRSAASVSTRSFAVRALVSPLSARTGGLCLSTDRSGSRYAVPDTDRLEAVQFRFVVQRDVLGRGSDEHRRRLGGENVGIGLHAVDGHR